MHLPYQPESQLVQPVVELVRGQAPRHPVPVLLALSSTLPVPLHAVVPVLIRQCDVHVLPHLLDHLLRLLVAVVLLLDHLGVCHPLRVVCNSCLVQRTDDSERTSIVTSDRCSF